MENLLKSTFSDLPPCLWQALSVGSATSHDSGLSSDDLAGFSLWPLGWELGDGFPCRAGVPADLDSVCQSLWLSP